MGQLIDSRFTSQDLLGDVVSSTWQKLEQSCFKGFLKKKIQSLD